MLKDNLARTFQRRGLALKVTDLNRDGVNEIVLATGKGDRTKARRSFVIIGEKK